MPRCRCRVCPESVDAVPHVTSPHTPYPSRLPPLSLTATFIAHPRCMIPMITIQVDKIDECIAYMNASHSCHARMQQCHIAISLECHIPMCLECLSVLPNKPNKPSSFSHTHTFEVDRRRLRHTCWECYCTCWMCYCTCSGHTPCGTHSPFTRHVRGR